MKIRPLHDNLLVKPMTKTEVTKSGIVLPETVNKEKSERGEVLAVGTGKLLDNGTVAPMTIQVGQKVIFKKYSPDEIKIDDQEYFIISESDVLAVLEE